MLKFYIVFSYLLTVPFAHSKEECSETFFECFDTDDRFVSAQSYPCEKGLRQVKQKAQWNDPRKMEHGAAVVLKCEPCGPCYPHSWVPIPSQQPQPLLTQTPSSATIATKSAVQLGMSMIEVKRVWGEPNDISRSVSETAKGVKTIEVWIYQKDAYTTPSSLVFRDGVLDDISRGSNPVSSRKALSNETPPTYSNEVRFVPNSNGNCQTVDQIAADGKRCGNRAANVKTGGR